MPHQSFRRGPIAFSILLGFLINSIPVHAGSIRSTWIVQFSSRQAQQLAEKELQSLVKHAGARYEPLLVQTLAVGKITVPRPISPESRHLLKEKIRRTSGLLRLEENIDFQSDESSTSPVTLSSLGTRPLLPGTPDDYFSKQWALRNEGHNEPISIDKMSPVAGVPGCDINAEKAWQINSGHPTIRIALIDSGVDYTHPDLAGNIWTNEKERMGQPGVDDDGNGYVDDIHGFNFVTHTGDPMDDRGHGTHCAGSMAARHDGHGISGVLANAQILAIKFMDGSGHGGLDAALEALEYAIRAKPSVINCSWGGDVQSEILKELIKKAGDNNIMVVAAAGNLRGRDNDANPAYPASYDFDHVISVSAHDAQAWHAHFSSWGKKSVDLAAPGSNILSTSLQSGYKVSSGTSMAAPIVTAAVALLRDTHPELSLREIHERIVNRAVPEANLKDKNASGGRLDLFRLIQN